MEILNLTQHPATEDQLKAGVEEPVNKQQVKDLLTFVEMPDREEIQERARLLASVAGWSGYEYAMIGGAPYLMSDLEEELKCIGVIPVYSFSKRESVEVVENGEVHKKMVFKHLGFI